MSAWKISKKVSRVRRNRLEQKRSYNSIVSDLVKNSRVIKCTRSEYRKLRGFYRVEITIEAPKQVVDTFYNGRTGYRAQFLESPRQGKIANAHVLLQLYPKIESFVLAQPRSRISASWLKISIINPEAKIWIYPGVWVRPFNRGGPTHLRNLKVDAWAEKHSPPGSQERMLSILGQLMPADETRLNIKGGWINLKGRKLPKKEITKNHTLRSKQLHKYGFTHAG